LNNAHAALPRRVIASNKAHVLRRLQEKQVSDRTHDMTRRVRTTHLVACRELDLEGERLPVDRRAAGGDGAA
jgi:SOS-response transcriptional repressor LexA